MAEELALVPGMDEVVSLVNIYRNARERNFEVVVIDAAPTGETVRLLSMPDTFQWYVGRLTSSATLNLARPLIKAVMPSAEILDAIQALSDRVKTLRGSTRGVIVRLEEDGRVVWRPDGTESELMALPESLLRETNARKGAI